jgi:hypothetical protein
MPGYSKAPRGLFVLLRVTRIFTRSSISPGPSSRQCPARYSFRAGQNLPDKEFRYLRTVIVTAAVHRGFNSELAPLLLTFRHWAGVSPYTSSYELAETCGFGKQSAGPFLCGPSQLHEFSFHRPGRSFSRSYGSILPSSLTRVLPIALVFSTRLPVLVCGTDTGVSTLRGFSWQFGLDHFWPCGTAYNPSDSPRGFSYEDHCPTGSDRDIHHPAGLPSCVPPSLHAGGTGILTCCPSPTPLGLGLGPTNPTRIDLPSETLDIRRTWFLHVFATHAGILTSAGRKLSSRSALFSDLLQNAPLPLSSFSYQIRSFGVWLEPRYIFGARSLDQ